MNKLEIHPTIEFGQINMVEGKVNFGNLWENPFQSTLIQDEYLSEVVQRCFEIDPAKRFSISDILGLYYFADF